MFKKKRAYVLVAFVVMLAMMIPTFAMAAPIKANGNVTITLENTTNITETNAQINATIQQTSGKVSTVGFEIYGVFDNYCFRAEEKANISKSKFSAWYDLNKWWKTLDPGMTYNYRFFATKDGETFYSEYQWFETLNNSNTSQNLFDQKAWEQMCKQRYEFIVSEQGTIKKNGCVWYADHKMRYLINGTTKISSGIYYGSSGNGKDVFWNVKEYVDQPSKKGWYQVKYYGADALEQLMAGRQRVDNVLVSFPNSGSGSSKYGHVTMIDTIAVHPESGNIIVYCSDNDAPGIGKAYTLKEFYNRNTKLGSIIGAVHFYQ